MEIIHHFGLNIGREVDAQAFFDLGIHLERGPQHLPGSSIAALDISEDDPRWTEVQQLPEKFKITDFVRTKFSKSELTDATVLDIFALTHRGYPEPSGDPDYLEATYDLSEYCSKCGTGARQIRPFRLKSAPSLKRSVLQLNWVFDEFFVSAQVWADVFRPFGIDSWPVLMNRTGEEIVSVVQLRISDQAELELQDYGLTRCSYCSRAKTPLDLRGFAPAPTNVPSAMFRSVQYFGTGANAFNRIHVSAKLYQAIRDALLRGVEFYPCSSSRE